MPVYNEEKTILEVLNLISKVKINYPFELIITNDGSKDNTAKKIEQFVKKSKIPVTFINNSHNQGKGGAMRDGFKAANGDIIIVQDADLEYDPDEYKDLIKPFENGAKVVYGSRILGQRPESKSLFFKGKHPNASFLAYFGGITITFFTNILFNAKLTDEPTCYKCYRSEVIKTNQFKNDDFAWEPEITAKILKKKIIIHEVPISYFPRTAKEGKKINWKDAVKAIMILFKERFQN